MIYPLIKIRALETRAHNRGHAYATEPRRLPEEHPVFVRKNGKLAKRPYAIGIGGFPPGWETGGKVGTFSPSRAQQVDPVKVVTVEGSVIPNAFRPLPWAIAFWTPSSIADSAARFCSGDGHV